MEKTIDLKEKVTPKKSSSAYVEKDTIIVLGVVGLFFLVAWIVMEKLCMPADLFIGIVASSYVSLIMLIVSYTTKKQKSIDTFENSVIEICVKYKFILNSFKNGDAKGGGYIIFINETIKHIQDFQKECDTLDYTSENFKKAQKLIFNKIYKNLLRIREYLTPLLKETGEIFEEKKENSVYVKLGSEIEKIIDNTRAIDEFISEEDYKRKLLQVESEVETMCFEHTISKLNKTVDQIICNMIKREM